MTFDEPVTEVTAAAEAALVPGEPEPMVDGAPGALLVIVVLNAQRFADVLDTSNLATFWARHGKPDVCASEPRIVACR